ncbi:MAG: transposase IS200-family protein [Acidobacteriaceae bacterium]|nr:transposase IS200-family protein [Acidobacteriaceae bacterium]
MQAIKQGFARRVLRALRQQRPGPLKIPEHVWQHRFYDFNLWTERKRIEKLRYIHRNPLLKGLVKEPEQWLWSSYRSYALGEKGPVQINQMGEVQS